MLRENHRIIVRLHRAADILITAACFVAAYFIKRNLLPGDLGGLATVQSYLQSHVTDELIFAMPLRKIENADRYIVIAESMGIRVRIIPGRQLHYLSYTPDVASIRVAEFSGVQTLTLQSTPRNEGLLLIKDIMDYSLAAIMTLILSPVFLVISLCIFAASPGPVLYRQVRLGRNGRQFNVLKFRTMIPDADRLLEDLKDLNEADGPAFAVDHHLSRAFSLDLLGDFLIKKREGYVYK